MPLTSRCTNTCSKNACPDGWVGGGMEDCNLGKCNWELFRIMMFIASLLTAPLHVAAQLIQSIKGRANFRD